MKSLIKERCEILVTSMYAAKSANLKSISTWLACSEAAASFFVGDIKVYDILRREGNRRSGCYKLTDDLLHQIELESERQHGDLSGAIRRVVSSRLGTKARKPIERVVLSNGKKLIKIEDRKEVDDNTRQAIDFLSRILESHSDLKVENELLREENKALRDDVNKLRSELGNLKSLINKINL